MKKSIAGAMLLVACAGGPPEDTRPPNSEEQQIINFDLKRLQAETPVVQSLLRSAKPLFNVNNEPIANNHQLIEDLDQVQADVFFYRDSDRFVVADRAHETYKGLAHGDWNKSFDNNYIVLDPWEKDGQWHGSSVGLYMHESTHFYSIDDKEKHNHMKRTMREGDYKDRIDYVLTEIDPPYLMDALYAFDIIVKEHMTKISNSSERLNSKIAGVADESDAKRQTWDMKDDMVTELADLTEDGFENMIDEILLNTKHIKQYERLGISSDELRRALENSKELKEIYQELVGNEMKEVREICSEYDAETNSLVENAEGQVCFPAESQSETQDENKKRRDELMPPRPRAW
ncbi:MAG: hypothetical protein ABH846_01165 [Patescibacteria group bacterium]